MAACGLGHIVEGAGAQAVSVSGLRHYVWAEESYPELFLISLAQDCTQPRISSSLPPLGAGGSAKHWDFIKGPVKIY